MELPRVVDELESDLWSGSDMGINDLIGIAYVLIPIYPEGGKVNWDRCRARC